MAYQVKKMDQSELFDQKLRRHNEMVELYMLKWKGLEKTEQFKKERKNFPKKLNHSRMKYLYNLLKEYGSWDNIKKADIMKKAAYYRALSDFRQIGYDKTYISTQEFKVSTNFEEYFLELQVNANKLKLRFRGL